MSKILSFDEFKKQRDSGASVQQLAEQAKGAASGQSDFSLLEAEPLFEGDGQPQNSAGILTFEQFQKAKSSGLSYEEIVQQTKARQPKAEQPTSEDELPDDSSFLDRLVDTITGGVKGWAGDQGTFFGKEMEALSHLGEKLGGNTSDYAGWATDELSAAAIGHETDAEKYAQQLQETRDMQEWGRNVSESGEYDLAKAKNGLGFGGRLLVDLGANALQMGLDSATSFLMGGAGGLAPLFTRASGGGMREAENEGASFNQQLLYGGTIGAIEALTEKMTGGLAKVYGKGTADELVESIVKNLAKSETGMKVLLVAADVLGEGLEEIVSDIANPYAKLIFDGGDALKKKFGSWEGFKEAVSEEVYDGLVGALMGTLGGSTKVVAGDYGKTSKRLGAESNFEQQLKEKGYDDESAEHYAQLMAKSYLGEKMSVEEMEDLFSMPTAVEVLESALKETAESAQKGGEEASTPTEAGAERVQPTQAQQGEAGDTGRQLVQQVITDMDVPQAAQRILMDGLDIGDADAQSYATGIRQAFQLGEMGLTLEQAQEQAQQTALSEAQFRHAWEIGAQKGGHRADTESAARQTARTADYESIEAFSREFKSPEKVTAIFDQAADTDVNEFAAGFRAAYDMGQSGVSAKYLTGADKDGNAYVPALANEQAKAAYDLGRQEAAANAQQRSETVAGQQQTDGNLKRAEGRVKIEGAKPEALRAAFNDRQNTAYRLTSYFAKTTGVNVVFYQSQADEKTGRFPSSQGRFEWKDDTIYIDLNSGVFKSKDVGNLGQYTMMRTFAHEFTHFIEKWNAARYNEFRQFVFQSLEEKGENIHDLIEKKQALDESGSMSYEQASREVVADAMMDILPDSRLVQQLANEHQTIFRKLLQKLREFTARMKQHFNETSSAAPRVARLLKEEGAYMESIVRMWDEIAKGAVQNYQGAKGEPFNSLSKPSNAAKDINVPAKEAQVVTDTDVGNTEEAPQKAAETQEATTEPKTPAKAENPAQEPESESEGAGEAAAQNEDSPEGAELRKLLNTSTSVQKNGFLYSIEFVPGAGYRGIIKRQSGHGLYPVENARDTILNRMFKTRSEAIDEIVRIAESGRLLIPKEEAPKPEKKTAAKAKETKTAKSSDAVKAWKDGTPSQKVAYRILSEHLEQGKGMPSKTLYAICDEAYGGTQAEGAYNRKDAYDAMELAVNRYMLDVMRQYNDGSVENALKGLAEAQRILSLLPTQNVRTQEQQDFQQFSTPPSIAYLAAWAARINNQDHVLEPSAGIGGLATFAKAWGAEVTVNELSKRRYGLLHAMGFDHIFNENAEQIDNVLPDEIQPTVVVMNPPFSSTAGRTKNNKTSNAERHINQALERLNDGGRLVAVLGRGMADANYSRYWDKLRERYTIRANIGIDGENYKKYGTTFDVQIVVIDKTGPQGAAKTVTGSYTDLTKVPSVLEGIRNDRGTETEREPRVAGNQESAAPAAGEPKPVHPAVDQADAETGRERGADRRSPDAGRSRESGNADVQRAERGAEPVQDARTAERGAVERERAAEEGARDTEGAEKAEAPRPQPDAGGNGAVADVQGESGKQRRGLSAKPARSGQVEQESQSDDGVYASYKPPKLTTSGSRAHPATLVESAAMAAVDMPEATYTPHLPENVVKNNLSEAQMVSVTYAGQAHEQKLPSGERRGFFIGDGTGVGKGRQISGIILDNFEQGRKKAVWISEKQSLYNDAQRDWTETTGRSKDEVHDLSKVKLQNAPDFKDGILYTTYDTLRTEKNGKSRVQQIADWFGKDYDGVIAFDEAHNMGNLLGKRGKFGKAKGSAKAMAAVELQRLLPNARVVYVSATAATEVDGLAFASRLGLWGKGTAFTDVNDFVSKIGSSGLAAMELVIRDMKAMGMYVARSISYNGVEYGTIQHDLDPIQRTIYDTMSRAWQTTMKSVEESLESTRAKYNSAARRNAIGQYYGAMQRFYNQVLTSMSMPSVIADMRKQLAAGKSCVLQIVNTNQAEADRQIASIKAEGGELDEMDLTPRGTLIDYLMKCYPVTQFEEYTDDDGNTQSRPVLNSKGEPVIDKAAERKRDALIREVEQMSIPDGPLEMLFNAFGTDEVSEITGRTRRVVPKKQADGSISRVEEKRTPKSREADVNAFQNGDKRILVFNNAGGTGKSYHADLRANNQQQRVHYVLQPGWEASRAVQGFGRTHRSNEASAPIYKLVTTNIKGQKRFTSTIARRLDQLGALTKGQRDTGSGMFGASDNLETDLARDSLREFYIRLGKNRLDGIDGRSVLRKLGLLEKFTDEHGAFKVNDTLARDISTFLNRILVLEVDEQNRVFDAFINIYETEMEQAIAAGTLDRGMENVKADKIEIVDDSVIKEQKGSGAATHYVQAKVYTKPKIITTVAEAEGLRSGFIGLYRTKAGDVRAVYRVADKTTEWGAIQKQYKLQSPNRSKSSVWQENSFEKNAEAIPKGEWQAEWEKEIAKVPEYNEDTKHMLTGALLPIWDTLPQEGSTKVQRLIADDGTAYLGRVIAPDQIDSVLSRFNINRTKETFTAQQVMDKAVQKGTRFNLSYQRASIFRSRVSGEWRLEYSQPYNPWAVKTMYPDMLMEKINWQNRFFIPLNEKGRAMLDKILEQNPVASTSEDGDAVELSTRRETLSNREVLRIAADEIDVDGLTDGEKDALRIFHERLARLRDAQEKRAELGRQYREQQFTKGGSRQEADRIHSAMKVLDSKIKSLEGSLLSLENKDVLKRVLEKARRVVEQEERKHGDEKLRRYRERRNEGESARKYRDRIRAQVLEFAKFMTSPSNKDIRKHVPAEIQKTVADFLDCINLSSKTSLSTSGVKTTQADEKYIKAMRNLKAAIKHNVDSHGLYSGFADLPEGFIESFDKLIDTAQQLMESNKGVFVVNQMNAAELRELSKMLKILKHHIQTMNVFHNNAMFQHVDDAGEDTVQHLKPFKTSKNSGTIYKALRFDYMRPSYAFEHFGKGGQSIEHELREGQATLSFLADKVIAFVKKTYDGKEVEAWRNDIKEFSLSDGKSIRLPATQIMSLIELNRRAQALPHIYGDGFRAANFKENNKVQLDDGHTVTLDDVQQMVGALTPRQIEVADALQKFMATECAEWDNYVSMARFGVEQATDEHYFPINSDGRYLPATADETPDVAGLYALLNMSFTKELKENASNQIILYDIFDVFANHTASMAQYRAFALPVLDALRWLNYKNDETTVRDQLSKAFGAPEESRPGSGSKGYAEQFVINLIRAYNGTEAQGDPYDAKGMKGLHRFNRAQIAFNVRVMVQQPLAITRAAMILSPARLRQGIGMSATHLRKLAEEMEAHSGIASWKKKGFYDTNISRGLTELIKQNKSIEDKVTDWGTKGAEVADRFTWAAIWYAAKATVKRGSYGSEEAYFKAVTDLFEDVIYKTQVVDSVLTKSEFLRAKGFFPRMLGSFMSEPLTTISMLTDAYFKYTDDMQRGMSRSEAWKRNGGNIAKTAAVYAVGQVLLATVQAVIDAWRDDDDYETIMQKYIEALKDNIVEELMPLGKLPGIPKAIWEAMKYAGDKTGLFDKMGLNLYSNGISDGWLQYARYLKKSFDITIDLLQGNQTNYTKYGAIYNLMRAVAGMTGLPIATFWREIQDLWNHTVGHFTPDKKLKTYRVKDENGIKYALQDGYITEERAVELLLEKGAAKNENEAFFKVQEWANGEKKYDALKTAIVAGSGADYLSAMTVLTDHGIREKEAYSAAKSFIKEMYLGEFSSTANSDIAGAKRFNDLQAASALAKYAGMENDEAAKLVAEWKDTLQFTKQHGSEYEKYGLTVAQAKYFYSTAKNSTTLSTYAAQVDKYGLDTVKSYYGEDDGGWRETGLTIEQYSAYRKGYANCKGVDNNGDGKADPYTKQAQVLQVIDALPVSNEVKDALYLKNGYSKWTINKAPWRG